MEGLKPLAALVLCLGPLAGTVRALHARQEPGSGVHDDELLTRLAAELGRLERGVAPDVVGQPLATLFAGSPARMFDALSSSELSFADGRVLTLGERERAALLEGARRLGRAALVGPWTTGAGGTAAQRRTAIELVGLCGHATDLETALRAATPAVTNESGDPEAMRLLEEAAARLLARAPDMLVVLRPAILHSAPAVSGHLIRSLGHAPDEGTLEFLEELLAFDERLELPLLSEIERVARRSAPPFDEDLCARVGSYLRSPDRQLVRTAATTLAVLRDEAALPALLELCANPDAALSAAAFLALERTTGLSLPRRAERWRSWFQAEQRWLREESPRVCSALWSDEVPQVLAALRTLGGHRLERRRFAHAVVPLLEHASAAVRGQTCRTLSALGSSEMRDAIERLLRDADASVSAAAREALRALGDATGSSSPPGAGPAGGGGGR